MERVDRSDSCRHLPLSALLIMLVGMMILVSSADAVELARMRGLQLQEIGSSFFSLPTETEIRITGRIFAERLNESSPAWILDSRTREVVWESDQAEVVDERRATMEIEGSVTLPEGEYEVYLATYPVRSRGRDIGDWISSLIRGGLSWNGLEEASHKLEIRITADRGAAGGENTVERVQEILGNGAFLAVTAIGDDFYEEQGFEIEQPTEIEIYGLGEADRDGSFDSAWIVDTATLETVWRFHYWSSERGGGAKKNRAVRTTIELDPGLYTVYVATDGSHSWPGLNNEPPFDPMAWGLSLRALEPDKVRSVDASQLARRFEKSLIAELVALGDHESRSAGFTLTRKLDARVIAIGEGQDGKMYDRSWLVDARTMKTLWRMSHSRTEHAGGATKNRVEQTALTLEPGSYLLHAMTDGSHAFGDWNAAPPFQRDRWGVTLVAASKLGDGDVVPYDIEDDPSTLAALFPIGDDAHETATFTLPTSQTVHVYALGEGDGGEMYDYAWISEPGSGRMIWEMTYRMTEHAGGAKKNRRYLGDLALEAGTYEVHYVSDGSHSALDWNSTPPDDPGSWGVTVRSAAGS